VAAADIPSEASGIVPDIVAVDMVVVDMVVVDMVLVRMDPPSAADMVAGVVLLPGVAGVVPLLPEAVGVALPLPEVAGAVLLPAAVLLVTLLRRLHS